MPQLQKSIRLLGVACVLMLSWLLLDCSAGELNVDTQEKILLAWVGTGSVVNFALAPLVSHVGRWPQLAAIP